MAPPFPKTITRVHDDFDKPVRVEGQGHDLVVHGEIPKEINGTFYRIIVDPHMYPRKGCEDEVNMNGDGMTGAIRIKDGKADFKQKYVETDRFILERVTGEKLFGRYRNRFTDDPVVQDVLHSTANTNIIYHNGVCLALKEDSPPYAIDPHSLETIGLHTFNGQISDKVPFTAHPKFDPRTGELIAYGYQAKGDATRDLVYWTISPDGKVTEEVWTEMPYVGSIHDIAITENYVIFCLIPIVTDMDVLLKGGPYYEFREDLPLCWGILPRRGAKPGDIKWFKYINAFVGHLGNAYEEDGKIILDTCIAFMNVFWFFPPRGKEVTPVPERSKRGGGYCRFTLDYNADPSKQLADPSYMDTTPGEYPRVDDRYVGKPYTKVFMGHLDTSKPMHKIWNGGYGFGFNGVKQIDVTTGKVTSWWAGENSGVQEPVFCPRSPDAPEGDGWLIFLCNRLLSYTSDLIILDTADFSKPVAVVEMPLRQHIGFHGNWVDAADMRDWQPLVAMPKVPEHLKPILAEIQERQKAQTGANGHANGSGINGHANGMPADPYADWHGVGDISLMR